MLSSLFESDELNELEPIQLTLESNVTDDPSEYWNFRKQSILKNLEEVSKFIEKKDVIYRKRMNQITTCKQTLQTRGVKLPNTTRPYRLKALSDVFYTYSGYLSENDLIPQLKEELRLNNILFETYPKKISILIKSLVVLINKSLKAIGPEASAEILVDGLRKLDHPVEIINSNVYFPQSKFLRATVIKRPKLDLTLNRDNLDFLAQSLPILYSSKSVQVARELSVANGSYGKFTNLSPTINIELSKLNYLLDKAEELLQGNYKFNDKYVSLNLEFKELDLALTRLCNYNSSIDNPELEKLTQNVVMYGSNLIHLQLTPATDRAVESSVISRSLVSIVRDIVGIN
jgi:hypothetical protein